MICVINDRTKPKVQCFSWTNPAPCYGAHCLVYCIWLDPGRLTGNWQLEGKSPSECVSFQQALRISVKPGHSLWKQFYFYQHQVKPAVNGPFKKTQSTSVFLHTCINSFPLQVKMFTNVSHLGTTSCSLNLLMDLKNALPDDTTTNSKNQERCGGPERVEANGGLDVETRKRKMLGKGQESVGGKENKWKWRVWERGGGGGVLGGGPLKTKAAAEIRPEDDELSAVWNQRVFFLNWSLKN